VVYLRCKRKEQKPQTKEQKMKNLKITASNHDKSNSVITLIRSEDRAERTINLLRQCGYQTIKSEI